MSRRATRQDVAVAAGVSGATVSRVYNNPELVDKATIERVRTAAETLGFVPDRHAAALRRGRSSTFLFVEIAPGPGYQWPSQRAYQSLYGEIVRSVLHAVEGTSFSLQLVSLPTVDAIATLADRDFAGLVGFDVTDQAVADRLAALGRPVVCCHHGDHLKGVSTLCTDNRAGGRLQADLVPPERPTVYVTGLRDEVRSHRLRTEGFLEARPDAALVDGAVGFAEGRRVGKDLAPRFRTGDLASVACVNDLTALGVVQGLADEGLLVPWDARVVGYDNLVLTELVGGGLPTVDARLPEVYARALEVLAAQASRGPEEVHEWVAPSALTASSSAPPSGRP